MSVDISGVKYIRRTIDTIYPVQLVSNTSLPTVMVRKNKTNADIMEINCMLQIVLSSKPADFRNTSFFIMQRAKDEFCDILKKVIGWFRDESKNDLFFENEEGKLTINTSYKDLVATIYEARRDCKVMTIMPCVIINGDETREEGVSIFINTVDSMVQLSFRNLIRLYNEIKSFNYATEASLVLESFFYSRVYDRIFDQDQYIGNGDGTFTQLKRSNNFGF